jgi:hypothetical protein
LGEPQCRQGGPRLPAFAVWFAEYGEGLFGALCLAEPHQDVQQQPPCGRDQQVRRCEVPGQLLGGLQSRQRILVTATCQLHPGRAHQLVRLTDSEPQVGLADLGQLPLQAQPVQAHANGWLAQRPDRVH